VRFWAQHRTLDATNFNASTMRKEAVGLFETLLVIYKTKGCHKPEDHCLHYYSRENLKYNFNIFTVIPRVHCECN